MIPDEISEQIAGGGGGIALHTAPPSRMCRVGVGVGQEELGWISVRARLHIISTSTPNAHNVEAFLEQCQAHNNSKMTALARVMIGVPASIWILISAHSNERWW